MSKLKLAAGPCEACPYRKDAPSGLWAAKEYDKLPCYDRETSAQPFVPFACHAVPDNLCFGWAVCHSRRGHAKELLSLRILDINVSGVMSPVPLFSSGKAACAHGKRKINKPSRVAQKMARKLVNKYERLQ